MILDEVVALIDAGQTALAQARLADLLRQDLRNEQAWFLLAQCVETNDRRRQCLERVLALNPSNDRARRLVAQLDSQPAPAPVSASPGPPDNAAPLPSLQPGSEIFQPRAFELLGAAPASEAGGEAFMPRPFDLSGESESGEIAGADSRLAAADSHPPWIRRPAADPDS